MSSSPLPHPLSLSSILRVLKGPGPQSAKSSGASRVPPGLTCGFSHDFLGPKGAPRQAKRPQEAYKTAQEGPESPKDPSKMPKMASRRPKKLPGRPTRPPKRQKFLIFLWFLKVFGLVAFSAFRRSKTAQEAPKIAPRQPKRTPRGPEEEPTPAQEGPRRP